MTVVFAIHPDGPETWEQSCPVRDEHKEENGGDKRKELPCLLFILGHALHEIKERLKDDFDDILHPTRNKGGIFGGPSDDPDEKRAHNHANEKSVGHRHSPNTKQFFRRD